jgi:hypothetical protein
MLIFRYPISMVEKISTLLINKGFAVGIEHSGLRGNGLKRVTEKCQIRLYKFEKS